MKKRSIQVVLNGNGSNRVHVFCSALSVGSHLDRKEQRRWFICTGLQVDKCSVLHVPFPVDYMFILHGCMHDLGIDDASGSWTHDHVCQRLWKKRLLDLRFLFPVCIVLLLTSCLPYILSIFVGPSDTCRPRWLSVPDVLSSGKDCSLCIYSKGNR